MSRARWRVAMHTDPFTVHTWFPLAGLSALDAGAVIELVWVRRRGLPPVRAVHWLEVHDRETGIRASICLDLDDRGELTAPERSAQADLTWKRSYVPGAYGDARVVPFGLLLKCRSGHERRLPMYLRAPRRALAAWRDLPPTWTAYESTPAGRATVLFQVRAWDPNDEPAGDERAARNDERAEVVRALRAALGDRFVGGFVPTPHARERYADCLADRPTDRASFLELVHGSRICISTQGLRASNPYKLAEYTAASRAIVSHPLHHALPEPLDGIATFTDADACAETCVRLLDDPDAIAEMQSASAAHWRRFGRPDVLVRRRLEELPQTLGISRSS